MKVLFLALALVGCESTAIQPSMRPSCSSTADRQALADFIISCSTAANPLSDEEGEDLVAQCEQTGIRTLCPTVKHCWRESGMSWEPCP